MPTLTAEARAKALGLRTYRIGPDAYKVECISNECEHKLPERLRDDIAARCGESPEQRYIRDPYRIQALSKLRFWHVVTIAFDATYDRCDCIHGIHLYRGVCHHIGAVRRRRDFERPSVSIDALPTPECKELCRTLVPAGEGHSNSCPHAEA